MREVIKKEFARYTVIFVAYRLDAVMDYDKVIVMSKGEIAEQDRLSELLKASDGKFRELWQVGKRETEREDDRIKQTEEGISAA